MDTAPTTAEKWVQRSWQGKALRAAIAVAPTIFATIVVIVLLRVTASPTDLVHALGRMAAIALVGFATANLVNRLADRLLPLAALLQLSLAFPDQAPSRFRMAIRASSTRALSREISSAKENGLSSDQTKAAEQILLLTSAVGEHDRLTRGHSERVRVYARMIGEQMGIEGNELEKLQWGAILHDIGKLSVPTELLNKPSKLTDEEWAIVSGHPAAGGELIAPVSAFLGKWAMAAVSHHEKFDGSGYPRGVSGASIPLAGRIVAVADAYEVMTATRSYKKPMAAEDARAELTRSAGTHFDPDVVRAFLTVSIGDLNRARGPMGIFASIPILGPILASTARLASQVHTIPTAIAGAAPASAAAAGALAVATAGGAVDAPPPVELPLTAISVPASTSTTIPASLSDQTEPTTIQSTEPSGSDDDPFDREIEGPDESVMPTTTAPRQADVEVESPDTSMIAPSVTRSRPTEPTISIPATSTSTPTTIPPTTTTSVQDDVQADPAYTVLSGQVLEVTTSPADLSLNGPYQHDDAVWVYDEGRTVSNDEVEVDEEVYPAGSTFCSHYFTASPLGPGVTRNAFAVAFADPIIAVAFTDADLDRSDVLTIPGTIFDGWRGIEFRPGIGSDQLSVEANTVEVTLRIDAGKVDAFRVITACP